MKRGGWSGSSFGGGGFGGSGSRNFGNLFNNSNSGKFNFNDFSSIRRNESNFNYNLPSARQSINDLFPSVLPSNSAKANDSLRLMSECMNSTTINKSEYSSISPRFPQV